MDNLKRLYSMQGNFDIVISVLKSMLTNLVLKIRANKGKQIWSDIDKINIELTPLNVFWRDFKPCNKLECPNNFL